MRSFYHKNHKLEVSELLPEQERRVLEVRLALRGGGLRPGDLVRLIDSECLNCGPIRKGGMPLQSIATVKSSWKSFGTMDEAVHIATFTNDHDEWYVCARCVRIERLADEKEQGLDVRHP